MIEHLTGAHANNGRNALSLFPRAPVRHSNRRGSAGPFSEPQRRQKHWSLAASSHRSDGGFPIVPGTSTAILPPEHGPRFPPEDSFDRRVSGVQGGLVEPDDGLACRTCSLTYPVRGGIPELFVPESGPSIDPSALRIKTDEEAARTIAEMAAIDTGFIRSQRAFYGLYFLLVFSAVMKWAPAAIAVLGIFAADWVWFRASRGRVLRRYASNPLRLRTAADYRAVDDAYAREGRAQPGMSDWVRLARRALGESCTGALGGAAAESPEGAGGESTGGASGEVTGDPDDERYRDIHRVWREASRPGEVVVDVGANDGCAFTKFGIGENSTFIGIDVSRSLLEKFRAEAPDQTAIQADGACLPLRDGTVDFLFCTETLEHIADPHAAMDEFVRVLKPGGRLMVQSPNAHRIRNLNLFHLLSLFASLGDRPRASQEGRPREHVAQRRHLSLGLLEAGLQETSRRKTLPHHRALQPFILFPRFSHPREYRPVPPEGAAVRIAPRDPPSRRRSRGRRREGVRVPA